MYSYIFLIYANVNIYIFIYLCMCSNRKLPWYGCTFTHVNNHILSQCSLIMPHVLKPAWFLFLIYIILSLKVRTSKADTYPVRTGPSWGLNHVGHKCPVVHVPRVHMPQQGPVQGQAVPRSQSVNTSITVSFSSSSLLNHKKNCTRSG